MRILCCHPGASWAVSDVHDGLVRGFESLGHEVVRYQLDSRINMSVSWFRYLQRRQKKLGGPLANTPPSIADIQYHAGLGLIERALRFEPDWVVVISAIYLHPDILTMLRRAGQRIALVLTESPYDMEHEARLAPWAHIVWTNERTSVAPLRAVNPNTYYLPVAYDPARLQEDGDLSWLAGKYQSLDDVAAHDVVFVGTAFQERVDFLEQIDWSGINLGLYGEWSLVKRNSPIKPFVRGGLTSPQETMTLYRKAKIGLNLYRQSKGFGSNAPRIEYAESLNPRAYELAAAGVCQVSDHRAEATDVFRGSVLTFSSPRHCQELLNWYLNDLELCRVTARNAKHYVQEHTYVKRAAQVCEQLQARLETRSLVAV